MPLGPHVKQFDIIRQLAGTVLNPFNKKPSVSGPCDGPILKLFHKVTLYILFGGYVAIAYSWWHKDVLTCINKYNADLQMRPDFLNICTSYLFVNDDEGQIDGRQYLLYYRWMHWVLLIAGCMYYIPHKMVKRAEDPKLQKLFELLESAQHSKEDAGVREACSYFSLNRGTHNNIYFKYVLLNVFAVVLHVSMFFGMDAVLLGNFYDLGISTAPFNRDITNFTDPLSTRFPPFAYCEITEFHKLVNERTERYGCHLTYMELYEKYFIILWVWMILLFVFASVYMVYILFMTFKPARPFFLPYYKPYFAVKHDIDNINAGLNSLNIGDFYLLTRMKSCFSPNIFYQVLRTMFKVEEMEVKEKMAFIPVLNQEQPMLKHRGRIPKDTLLHMGK